MISPVSPRRRWSRLFLVDTTINYGGEEEEDNDDDEEKDEEEDNV